MCGLANYCWQAVICCRVSNDVALGGVTPAAAAAAADLPAAAEEAAAPPATRTQTFCFFKQMSNVCTTSYMGTV